MHLADFFFLFVFLCVVSGFIYFIIEIIRGNVKWGNTMDAEHNAAFDDDHFRYENQSFDGSPSSDLHSSYSYHDEYNILNGRSPGTQ